MWNISADCTLKYSPENEPNQVQVSQFQGVSGEINYIEINNLEGNTRYKYFLEYKNTKSGKLITSPDYFFQTQRTLGETFVFTIESDEHLYDKKGINDLYELCLRNQEADKPDFMLSLGDIFGDDHYPTTITSTQVDTLHKYYRPLLGTICHSIPFFVCLGNHEGENDFFLRQNPPNNLAAWSTLSRKKYFPNPYPNDFYTGNDVQEEFGINYPENYYSWHWGNALFVVLDVYRDQNDTTEKPKDWDWSLGYKQYSWLRSTLEQSKAQYKFVFAHHNRGQGRGGIIPAKYCEWGGLDPNGRTYGFDKNRPGWGKPIHQLFVDNGVTIFFQGHDHLFAHEILNNVVYQEVPMPSDTTYEIGMLANADAYTSDTLKGSGHLKVTVSPQQVTVDFIRAVLPKDTFITQMRNREVAFSYTLTSKPTSILESETQNIKNTFIAFPNPSSNTLNFETNSPNEVIKRVELYSQLGQKVKDSISSLLDVRDVEDGIYYAIISVGSEQKRTIVVVQH